MSTQPVLVIRLGAMGDLLHVAPALSALKSQRPEIEIHWLIQPMYQDLVAQIPHVDHIWRFDPKAGWKAWIKLASQLRKSRWTTVINLQPSVKTWLLAQWILSWNQAGHQAIYHKEKLKVKGQEQRILPRRHAIEDFYEPFRRYFGLAAMAEIGVPVLERRKIATEDPVGDVRFSKRYIGLIPGVGKKRSNRAWEPSFYIQLIQYLLLETHHRILLIGGPDETALANQLIQETAYSEDRVENHCGGHDLLETMALLAQCDVVVGGDTGPLHLAAALGKSLVAIYGPTSIKRTGPITQSSESLKLLTPPEELSCWPCELASCPYTGDAHLACMKTISVESVLQNILELL